MTERDQDLERKMLDAVNEVVRGSDWAVPDGRGFVTEVVVLMGHTDVDGTQSMSFLYTGSPWSAEGLLDRTKRVFEDDMADD